MTDDLTPDPPDQRDEHIAELLEVPPLDEVTRRRLVATALDAAPAATGPGAARGRRLLAIAAAAVAVVAVGVGVVVIATGDDAGQNTATVAGRQERPKGAGEAQAGAATSPAPAPEGAPTADQSVAAPRNLGDLGDVTDPDRLRAAVSGVLNNGQLNSNQSRQSLPPCLSNRPATETPPLAVATGRYEKAAVVILVAPRALDSYEVTVLDAASCATRSSLTL